MAYRYRLRRNIANPNGKQQEGTLLWLLCNPSHAHEWRISQSDNTIDKVIEHTSNLGYKKLRVLNTYPLRNPKSSALVGLNDIQLGYRRNQQQSAVDCYVKKADRIICAWGGIVDKPKAANRKAATKILLDACIHHNHNRVGCFFYHNNKKFGYPWHPKPQGKILDISTMLYEVDTQALLDGGGKLKQGTGKIKRW